MKQENVVRILFVQERTEDAQQIISLLRNAGIAVRPAQVAVADELAAALAEHAPHLVLADPATPDLGLDTVLRETAATGKDIVVLAVADHVDDDLLDAMATQGVRGIVLPGRPGQLQAVVRREFESLNMRRGVRRLEAALRESERRCEALLDSSRDPIAYVHEGMHVRANHAYLEMFGFETFEDVEGMTLLDLVAPQDAADFKALLQRVSRGEKPPEKLTLHGLHSDGSEFDAVMQFAEATFEGEPCLQIIFRRQELDPELSRRVEEMQWRDPVSGLFNRAHMLEHIDKAAAEAGRGEGQHALLLIEPDGYRATLDAVGLAGADALLHDIATTIAGELSDTDVAGRISDHTFCVLASSSDQAAVTDLAQRVRKAIESRIMETGTHSISITVSIGGSLLGEKNASTHTLLDQAGERLRAVMDQGGNQVDIHNPAAQEQAEAAREKKWVEMIKDALKNDSFVLFYQQVISLQGADGEYYEILLRMNGPNGEILPGMFMPAAERNGLLPAIDRWVIGRAIQLLAERRRDGQPTTFMVKLTAQSLDDPALPAWIGEQLKARKVPGASLVLEMPESKVLTSLKPASAFVAAVKALGCAFALEQFGSGLNSFQLLKHVQADYLKIDRSFLADLPRHQDNQQRVREICKEAREQGRLTVAEWVQDAASTSILFTCGVDFVQGNFLQEPEKVVSHEMVH